MTTMTTENNSNGNKSTFGTVGQSEVGDGASNVESKIIKHNGSLNLLIQTSELTFLSHQIMNNIYF